MNLIQKKEIPNRIMRRIPIQIMKVIILTVQRNLQEALIFITINTLLQTSNLETVQNRII